MPSPWMQASDRIDPDTAMKHHLALLLALTMTVLAPLQAGAQASAAPAAPTRPAKPAAAATGALAGLGTQLPKGLDRAALIALFKLPPAHANLVTLVGAKPWPHRPDSYVAILCLMQNGPRQPGLQECRPSIPDQVAPGIYVGVVELKPGGTPRLVASSGLVERMTSWSDTTLPDTPAAARKDSHLRAQPQTWERFDLAPYRLRPQSAAFGVRAGWSEHDSNGSGEFEALYLFDLDGDSLRLVLAEPMMARTFTMGEFKSDGPRDMEEVQDSNILVISKYASEGYYNLQIKSKASGQARHFIWSEQHREYRSPMSQAQSR